jgi:hypothetical protein
MVEFDADYAVLTAHGGTIDSIHCSVDDPSVNASLLVQDPDLAHVEYPRMMEVLQKIYEESYHQLDLIIRHWRLSQRNYFIPCPEQ